MSARRVMSKYWCFTENNDAANYISNLNDLFERSNSHIQYICGQLEEGEHLHVQGYVQLKRSRPLSWVKNNISATAHFEIQRGTCEQARDYCRKEDHTTRAGSFVEFGDFQAGKGGRGARNDIHQLRDAVKEGKTQREIIEDDNLVVTFANHMRFHDRVRTLYKPPPRENGVRIILYVGAPGTGKTRRAYEEYPDLFEIPISNGTMWLDGFDDNKNVLFDDFMGKGSKIGLDNTLKFFDRYVRAVPFKGGYAWYRPEVIIITSNYHPRHWYDWSQREDSWKALKRRFTEIWYFPEGSDPEEQDNERYLEDHDYWPVIELREHY